MTSDPAIGPYAGWGGDGCTQEAFPGEDISDRPPPEESVPGLLALIEGDLWHELGDGHLILR